jgi:hypothetical protein
MFGSSALVALASASLAIASPALFDRHSFVVRGGVNHTVFEHAATGSTTSYVTNSGICETTSGVNQYSGYFSVGNNMVRNYLLSVSPTLSKEFLANVVLVLRGPL